MVLFVGRIFCDRKVKGMILKAVFSDFKRKNFYGHDSGKKKNAQDAGGIAG